MLQVLRFAVTSHKIFQFCLMPNKKDMECVRRASRLEVMMTAGCRICFQAELGPRDFIFNCLSPVSLAPRLTLSQPIAETLLIDFHHPTSSLS